MSYNRIHLCFLLIAVTPFHEFVTSVSSSKPQKSDVLLRKAKPRDEKLQREFSSMFSSKNAQLEADAISETPLPADIIKKIKEIAKLCGKHELFMDLTKPHMKAVKMLQDIFQGRKTKDLFDIAARIKDHPLVNYNLWLKAFLAVSMNMIEMKGLELPDFLALNPFGFVNTQALKDIKKGRAMTDECIHMDGRYTKDNDPVEQRLWYFREDFTMNVGHYVWHIVNMFNTNLTIDRRGEVFYYFHDNVLARYYAERLSNGLGATEPFILEEGYLLKEGYDPHLGEIGDKNMTFGPRSADQILSNITWLVEVYDAIIEDLDAHHFQHSNGSKISTNSSRAVSIFGDIMEGVANNQINPNRYLNLGLHNEMHDVVAALSSSGRGVMSTTQVAMRDPTFYRLHLHVSDMLDRQRSILPPHHASKGLHPLNWKGVSIGSMSVTSLPLEGRPDLKNNKLETFFQESSLSVNHTATLSFLTNKTIKYCIKHLNHRDFVYNFKIKWGSTKDVKATVRIFMAPKLDKNKKPIPFKVLRRRFFPMDTFTVTLHLGENLVTQSSRDNTLTVSAPFDNDDRTDERCSCGYPHHLLLPKGTEKGLEFYLFAMVTNAKDDVPKKSPTFPAVETKPACVPSYITCGEVGQMYPDAKPMGYPFDRPFGKYTNLDGKVKPIVEMKDFMLNNWNMKQITVKITHSPELLKSEESQSNDK